MKLAEDSQFRWTLFLLSTFSIFNAYHMHSWKFSSGTQLVHRVNSFQNIRQWLFSLLSHQCIEIQIIQVVFVLLGHQYIYAPNILVENSRKCFDNFGKFDLVNSRIVTLEQNLLEQSDHFGTVHVMHSRALYIIQQFIGPSSHGYISIQIIQQNFSEQS